MDPTTTCPLLDRLPPELRLKIYESLLTFSLPVKLRQVVPGSRDLAILRTNRQIYHEALSVFYDRNTIVATRNDFCRTTDSSLKTPLDLDRARHILIASFSRSIACMLSGPERQCDVCRPSAKGLIEALKTMPRLQTALVDYHAHITEMRLFRERLETGWRLEPVVTGGGSHALRLTGEAMEGLNVQFKCG